MTQKKTIRIKNLITAERIEKWTDEEVLTNLSAILGRASISTEYVTEVYEDGEIITHEVLVAVSGDKAIFSEPRALDWPLQRMAMPEIFKPTVN